MMANQDGGRPTPSSPRFELNAPAVTANVSRELVAHVENGWVVRAACQGTVDDTWFPEAAEPVRRAAAVGRCVPCPVRRSCLAFALATDQRYGVWGGTTDRQRDALRLDLAAGVPVVRVLDSATVRPGCALVAGVERGLGGLRGG